MTEPSALNPTTPPAAEGSRRRRGVTGWLPRSSVWYATIMLFLVSAVIEPGSVDSVSINAMLPFAGILAIAAVGQTLVIMQRGIDLSVPGMMTLSGLAVSEYAAGHGDELLPAVLVVLALALLVGLVNGLVVGFLTVTPLVATLAMIAILIGAAISYSGGTPSRAPADLSSFALDKTLGVSHVVWLALVFVVVMAVVVSRTVWGRRFVSVGASVQAARAAGVRVELARLSAYMAAAVCYAVAGIVLAGYLSTPNISMGESYLLPSVAAVVVGGTALTGGRGNIIGTAVAAVFLTQLSQLVLSMGAPTSTQLVIQSAVIAIAAALQVRDREAMLALLRGRRAAPTRA
jgi:ribose transport system permease protein